MRKINVAIVDRSVVVLKGFISIFKSSENMVVAATAHDYVELMENLMLKKVDVIIIDFLQTRITVADFVSIKTKYPHLRFIGLSQENNRAVINSYLLAGCDSFLLKECDEQEIYDAVGQTANGDKLLCGQIADKLALEEVSVNGRKAISCNGIVLSERELDIVKLIAEGFANKEIAEKLFLSNHTVNTHRKNIFNKIGVNNTAGMLMFAIKNDLIDTNFAHLKN